MRHLRYAGRAATIAAIGLALVVSTAPVAGASEGHGQRVARLVPPAQRVDGLTGGQLLGQVWYWGYALPASQNPLDGHPQCLPIGGTGHVMWVAGAITCTAPEGTDLLVYGGSSACSDVEDPPFFGADEAAQRACALALNQDRVAIHVTIDGGRPIEFLKPRFSTYSPQRHVLLPPGNDLGVDPQPATFTAQGWVGVLTHLCPGLHTVASENVYDDGSSSVFSYALRITPRR